VKYQDPERDGSCSKGWLWVVHNPVRNVSFFFWSTSRAASVLEEIVPIDYRGIIQCDGHSAYEAFAKRPERQGKIVIAGCTAHMRRKFFEAKAEGEDPQWVLTQVQRLYSIEARLREARAGPEEILQVRREHSDPILEQIKARLDHLQASKKHLPRSLTGEALTYASNQWEKLGVYLSDGRVQIDNNLVENAIRPSVIGKKNYPSCLRLRILASLWYCRSAAWRWLFLGDATTGGRAATFYTLIANAHREGINAEAYLTDIFERLPMATNQTVYRLTPKSWAAEQAMKQASLVQSTILAMQLRRPSPSGGTVTRMTDTEESPFNDFGRKPFGQLGSDGSPFLGGPMYDIHKKAAPWLERL
jgi:transposase